MAILFISDIQLNMDLYIERKELIEKASVLAWDEAPSNELNIFLTVYKYFGGFKNKVIIYRSKKNHNDNNNDNNKKK